MEEEITQLKRSLEAVLRAQEAGEKDRDAMVLTIDSLTNSNRVAPAPRRSPSASAQLPSRQPLQGGFSATRSTSSSHSPYRSRSAGGPAHADPMDQSGNIITKAGWRYSYKADNHYGSRRHLSAEERQAALQKKIYGLNMELDVLRKLLATRDSEYVHRTRILHTKLDAAKKRLKKTVDRENALKLEIHALNKKYTELVAENQRRGLASK